MIFFDDHYVWFCFMVGGEVAHFNTYNRSKKTEGGECGGTLTIWLWVTWNTIKNNLSSNLKACN